MGELNDVKAANALFLPAWNEAMRRAQQQPARSKQEEGMAFFRKALQNCDKEIERMMEEHHKSVAESAAKLAEYHKRRAMQDRFRSEAIERQLEGEQIRIEGINRQNMLESARIDELNREELMKKSLE